MGCLYQLTSPSGKSYIGITRKTAEDRFAGHVIHAIKGKRNTVLASAIRKYGSQTFDVKTLVIANDWAYLNELEKRAIIAFQSRRPHGYNMTDGGDGALMDRGENFGELVSRAMARPDIAEKVRRCAQLRAVTPGWREKISASKTGKTIGPASTLRKERIAEARRREWADPDLRKKRIDANRASRAPHVQFVCVRCGAAFSLPPWEAKRNPKYCSHQCYCRRSEKI
jgi:hypothetical protein